MGRSKCRMRAEAGATINSMVYMMRGNEQPLLGRLDAQRLGIIQLNMKGSQQKEDRVTRLERSMQWSRQALCQEARHRGRWTGR